MSRNPFRRFLALVALTLLLIGCESTGGAKNTGTATTPVEFETTVKQYVPIKAELTRQVVDPAPDPGPTGGTLLNGYTERGKALQSCNGQLEDIAKVQGTKPPC